MVKFHQPSMLTLMAARRVFWRHKDEFEAMTPQQREAYLARLTDPCDRNAMSGIFHRNLKS